MDKTDWAYSLVTELSVKVTMVMMLEQQYNFIIYNHMWKTQKPLM